VTQRGTDHAREGHDQCRTEKGEGQDGDTAGDAGAIDRNIAAAVEAPQQQRDRGGEHDEAENEANRRSSPSLHRGRLQGGDGRHA
jgi:hypothetical protein